MSDIEKTNILKTLQIKERELITRLLVKYPHRVLFIIANTIFSSFTSNITNVQDGQFYINDSEITSNKNGLGITPNFDVLGDPLSIFS